VATDSYRLAIRDVANVSAVATDRDLIVPSKALVELQRASSNLLTDASIGVALSEAEICFIVGNTSIASRLIDGNYPDYRQLIPAQYPNQLRVAKDTLLTSLRRAKLLASDATSSVRLAMKDKGVDITTQSHDKGEVTDNVDGDFTGDELTIAFNPNFLIDGIEAAPGDEVVLETSDSTRPAIVHAVDDVQYRYLLMPVRVQ
jgi:DNA polymerase-3 subunit beta